MTSAVRYLLAGCSALTMAACSDSDPGSTATTVAPGVSVVSVASTTADGDPDQVADIIRAFGVDRELAECINRELGDVANIDPSELTPELLSRTVCGTSLLAILSGADG